MKQWYALYVLLCSYISVLQIPMMINQTSINFDENSFHFYESNMWSNLELRIQLDANDINSNLKRPLNNSTKLSYNLHCGVFLGN